MFGLRDPLKNTDQTDAVVSDLKSTQVYGTATRSKMKLVMQPADMHYTDANGFAIPSVRFECLEVQTLEVAHEHASGSNQVPLWEVEWLGETSRALNGMAA